MCGLPFYFLEIFNVGFSIQVESAQYLGEFSFGEKSTEVRKHDVSQGRSVKVLVSLSFS